MNTNKAAEADGAPALTNNMSITNISDVLQSVLSDPITGGELRAQM